MSNEDDTGKSIDPSVTARIRKALRGGYEIGYGKPPAATRFRKGTSGNPTGRPRRKKPSQAALEPSAVPGPATCAMRDELTRDIVVQEAGGSRAMPFLQASLRNLEKLAFSGSVNATKELVRLATEEARRHDVEIAEDHAFWIEYREKFGAIAQLKEESGDGVPDWLPRPEDIDIRPNQLTVIHGPASPDQMVHYVTLARIRDQCIAKARYDSVMFPHMLARATQPHELPSELMLPHWLDMLLPKRMQLSGDAIHERMMAAVYTPRRRLEEELIETFEGVEGSDREALLNQPGIPIGHAIYELAARLGIDWTQLQATSTQPPKRYRATNAAD